jgi:hypothetical protein
MPGQCENVRMREGERVCCTGFGDDSIEIVRYDSSCGVGEEMTFSGRVEGLLMQVFRL